MEEGFVINRTVDSLHDAYNRLVQEDGSVRKEKKDYSSRGGITQKPIVSHNANSVQVGEVNFFKQHLF